MITKLLRSHATASVIVGTLITVELWMWAFDHLPHWAALLVLLGLLGGIWIMGRYLQRRREAWEAREAEARRSE